MHRSLSLRWFRLLLILTGCAIYANSLGAPFVFDDRSAIVENRDIRELLPLWRPAGESDLPHLNGRPVVRLSLALNYALDGLRVRGYRMANVAVHLLAALVLLGVLRRTLSGLDATNPVAAAAEPLARASALLWLVHPLHTECVDYVIQRTESAMGLFYLLTLYCAIRGATERRVWNALAVAACALGMASKEVMVTAPLLVFLYDRTFLFSSFTEMVRARRSLYAGLAGTWLILAALMVSRPQGETIGFSAEVGAWDYALQQSVLILHYVRLSLWPHPLILDYGPATGGPALGEVAPQLIALAALLLLTALLVLRRSALGFPLACFFLVLGPTSSVVPILSEVGAERRMYLPLAALIALYVTTGYWALQRLRDDAFARRWIGVAALTIALLLGGTTWKRNRDYRDHVSIWTTVVEAVPRNPRGHNNLGVALDAAGDRESAVRHYRRALELEPDYAEAHFNLGFASGAAGDRESAVRHYRRAVELEPDYYEAVNNLGLALQSLGKLEQASDRLTQALELRPDSPDAHFNLANVLAEQGRLDVAVQHYRKALFLKPTFSGAARNLRIVLARQREADSRAKQH